jgi:hypothetical protein
MANDGAPVVAAAGKASDSRIFLMISLVAASAAWRAFLGLATGFERTMFGIAFLPSSFSFFLRLITLGVLQSTLYLEILGVTSGGEFFSESRVLVVDRHLQQ